MTSENTAVPTTVPNETAVPVRGTAKTGPKSTSPVTIIQATACARRILGLISHSANAAARLTNPFHNSVSFPSERPLLRACRGRSRTVFRRAYRDTVTVPPASRGGAMPTTTGMLRRRVLTPPLDAVTFARRGFPVTATDHTRRLEAMPQAVICGFEWGIEARDQWETRTPAGAWSTATCAASPTRARRWPSRCATRWAAATPGDPRSAARPRRAAPVPGLHRHRVRDGPAAPAAVAQGPARPPGLGHTTRR